MADGHGTDRALGDAHPKGMIGPERRGTTMRGVILVVTILVVVLAGVPSPWNAILIVAACPLEVVEVVVLRRWSKRIDRRTRPTTGAAAMIGDTAEVVEACRPKGLVQLNGELWQARCDAGADPGDTVEVEAIDGLVLVVVRQPAIVT
jgi:membrane protein implicated in regulation of membrane protease activity